MYSFCISKCVFSIFHIADVTKQAECFISLPVATFRVRPAPCPVPRQNRAFFLRRARHQAENSQVSEHAYFDFCYLAETTAANLFPWHTGYGGVRISTKAGITLRE